jgi:hypothetical protein
MAGLCPSRYPEKYFRYPELASVSPEGVAIMED